MEIFLIYIITLIVTLATLGYRSITFNFLHSPFYYWVKEQQSEKIEIVGYGLNLTKGSCWNI